MLKRLIFVLAILALSAVAVQAGTVVGTVQTVKADTVIVKANLDKANWVGQGVKVKLNKKVKGVIISVQAPAEDSVKESVITIVAKKADKLKAKDEVSIKKYKVMSGC